MKIKNVIVIVLAFILAFSTFSACKKKEEEIDETPERAQHFVDSSKTLHKVSVKESNRKFVKDGKSDYKIIIALEDQVVVSAANYLASQIYSCTGVMLPVETDDGSFAWSNTAKYLVIEDKSLEDKANVKWATGYELKKSGYMIKTVGESVFMHVNSKYGYQMVVLAFLREVLGYEWLSSDTITFSKTGETLPDMDIVEKPDFDLTYSSSAETGQVKYAEGRTSENIFASVDGYFVHNSFIYLPKKTYLADHRKWYSDGDGTQLCYSAHGDKEEYDKMIETAAERVLYYLDQSPDCCTITFTQEDVNSACNCATCLACKEEFNSLTSTVLMFTNDLEDAVRAKLIERAWESGEEPREVEIVFFSYYQLKSAPVVETENGYETVKNPNNHIVTSKGEFDLPYKKTYPDGLKANERVGVMVAPIEAKYNKSFYDETSEENTLARTTFEKWSMVCDIVYAWIYDTNFHKYIFPYNSYDTLFETARCLKNNNTDFLFVQTQGYSGSFKNSNIPCFGSFKTYCTAAIRNDVNISYQDCMDKFFKAYFREAAEPMLEYFNKMTTYLKQLEMQYSDNFTGGIYDENIVNSSFWPYRMLLDWLDLCDEAYKRIEKYKTSDPGLYESLVKHIQIEELFPKYYICSSADYSKYYTAEALYELRYSFYKSATNVEFQLLGEGVQYALNTVYAQWGII